MLRTTASRLPSLSIRSLGQPTRARAAAAVVAPQLPTARSSTAVSRRWASVHVPNSGLDACPSPAEGVGKASAVKGKGKVWDSADEAIKDVKSGSLLLSAGAYLTCTVLS